MVISVSPWIVFMVVSHSHEVCFIAMHKDNKADFDGNIALYGI